MAASSSSSLVSVEASFFENLKGFILAVVSSAFIGSSFIVKKLGLQRAGASGTRARSGGYGYLKEPLWWIGMITMIVGELANFVAYMFAPAVLVTPLGALSIIVSAVLAHFFLKEKLQKMGILGCVLCIVGSTLIVLHAPSESSLTSVEEIWELATQPAFLLYLASAIAIVLVLILYCEPRYGQTNIMVYIGICSIIGSLTVMSVKAVGIAIKLTIEGSSQAASFQTWVFVMVAITCIITQLNYLNKVSAYISSFFASIFSFSGFEIRKIKS
ncbi:putative magnesium transporter nipa6 [Quercus suber]|uniref:Probable magnesium transporter n=1 Tax=Quercus suber TaxID=58331 RepID=A0AAW0KCI1_QUESU|nr:probable magnesium transporter NIPA6 [Quercus suber]